MVSTTFSPRKCVALQPCVQESAIFYSGVRVAYATLTLEVKIAQRLYALITLMVNDYCKRNSTAIHGLAGVGSW